MKYNSNFKSNLSLGMRALAISCGLLAAGNGTSNATIIYPLNAETLFSTITNHIYTLNTDMLELPGSQIMTVMAWDLYGPTPAAGPQICLRDFSSGGIANYHIPSNAESVPDVALAVDPTDPSVYKMAVVYLDVNYRMKFDTYKITGVGSGSLNISLINSLTLSGARCYFPHIDMLPDYDNMVNGFPSMHRFAISFGEYVGPGVLADIRETHGDISNPAALSPFQSITTGGNTVYGGDIAVSLDPVTKREHIYLAYVNNNNLVKSELILNSLLPPNAPAAVGPTMILAPSASGIPLPRIEAMGNNPLVTGMVPWVVSAMMNNQVWEFNPNMPGGYNCSPGVTPTDYNICAAVCAGSGRPPGNVCNDNYIIGYWNSSLGYLTQTIDAYTGAISTLYPDHYVANFSPVTLPGGTSKIPIALTSCSNTGNDLVTAFWDGTTNINFQAKPGVAGYKPLPSTAVNNVASKQSIKIYPNPASDKMVIQGVIKGTYSVSNIIGQTIATGIIDRDNYELNVQTFVPGSYNLSIRSLEGDQNVPFIKR